MAEQAKIAQKPGFAQQLEPIFSEQGLSQRSLRSQPRPTPPQPDFTQDSLTLNSQQEPGLNNLLAFRRNSNPR
ncbi:MAG: hypothetical protein CVV27_13025 [Candidatus Melainabacteria bacterium HGW-Melainabacteria-1]|nr:MAG: hypothetical protein CVV27_13025 [Candidatus Melainabacteria bacterium HGW-Melainabacteria-1]